MDTERELTQNRMGLKDGLRDELTATWPAWAYLAAITIAELLVALVDARVGVALHCLVLVALIFNVSLWWNRPIHNLLLGLTLAPTIRLMSAALPLARFPIIEWYVYTGFPLILNAFLVAHLLGLSLRDIGFRSMPFLQMLAITATGLALGYLEYLILKPSPLLRISSWQEIGLPALVLLVFTGFAEELIFRGVMQRAASMTFKRLSIFFVSALFALMHVGYRSVVDVLFVFAAGMFFGWLVARTRSLLGVTLAHGLTNIMLLLVLPFVLSR